MTSVPAEALVQDELLLRRGDEAQRYRVLAACMGNVVSEIKVFRGPSLPEISHPPLPLPH